MLAMRNSSGTMTTVLLGLMPVMSKLEVFSGTIMIFVSMVLPVAQIEPKAGPLAASDDQLELERLGRCGLSARQSRYTQLSLDLSGSQYYFTLYTDNLRLHLNLNSHTVTSTTSSIMSAIQIQKKALRTSMRALLTSLPVSFINAQCRLCVKIWCHPSTIWSHILSIHLSAQAITSHVLTLSIFKSCKSVSCYLSMPAAEVDTSGLVGEVMKHGTYFYQTISQFSWSPFHAF